MIVIGEHLFLMVELGVGAKVADDVVGGAAVAAAVEAALLSLLLLVSVIVDDENLLLKMNRSFKTKRDSCALSFFLLKHCKMNTFYQHIFL